MPRAAKQTLTNGTDQAERDKQGNKAVLEDGARISQKCCASSVENMATLPTIVRIRIVLATVAAWSDIREIKGQIVTGDAHVHTDGPIPTVPACLAAFGMNTCNIRDLTCMSEFLLSPEFEFERASDMSLDVEGSAGRYF